MGIRDWNFKREYFSSLTFEFYFCCIIPPEYLRFLSNPYIVLLTQRTSCFDRLRAEGAINRQKETVVLFILPPKQNNSNAAKMGLNWNFNLLGGINRARSYC